MSQSINILDRQYQRSIDRQLQRAGALRRWLTWIVGTSTVGACVLVCFLVIGVAITRGVIEQASVAALLAGMVLIGAVLAWASTSLWALARPLQRDQLAKAIEQKHGGLADRLTTLVHLETEFPKHRVLPTLASSPEAKAAYEQGRERELTLRWFYERIRQQASNVLAVQPVRQSYSSTRALIHGAVFLVLAALTAWFYSHYQPWSRLKGPAVIAAETVEQRQKNRAANEPPVLEIPAPTEQVIEKAETWGEVRITEPGGDLRITRLDSVSIQIEAAASEPITSVAWFTAKNGGQDEQHALPAPTDPGYAVYRDEINAAALQLQDWDVVTYFARAVTQDGKAYQSDVHFLEIVPLRAELEELPGGSDGQASEVLDRLTAMVQEQQEVVRQAYRQLRLSPANAEARTKERSDLANTEAQLEQAVRHLGAEVQSQFGPPVGEELGKQLDEAAQSLDRTEGSLREAKLEDSQRDAREALAKLAAARRFFQEMLAQHPQAAPKVDPDSPVPNPDRQEVLDEIRELRDRRDATQRALAQLAQREQSIRTQTATRQPPTYPQLSPQQEQLIAELEQAFQEFPELDRQFPQQSQDARNAVRQANQALQSAHPQTGPQLEQAQQKLRELAEAHRRQSESQQLRQAYRLKELLDQQAKVMREIEENPEERKPEQVEQEAKTTQEAVEQLNKLANETPTQESFSPPLREALKEENRQKLNAQCQGMCKAGSSGERGQAAGQAAQSLEDITKAFEKSQPRSPNGVPKPGESLENDSQQALARGLRELESLARDAERAAQQPSSENPEAGEQPMPGEEPGPSQQPNPGPAPKPAPGPNPGPQPSPGPGPNPGPQPKPGPQPQPGPIPKPGSAQDPSPGQQPGSTPAPGGRSMQRLSAAQQQQLREDAMSSLEEGIFGSYGHNERSKAMVRRLRETIGDQRTPIDSRIVESLRNSIQDIRREASVKDDEEKTPGPAAFINSERLPPAYRQPIQSYFQKLSEQK